MDACLSATACLSQHASVALEKSFRALGASIGRRPKSYFFGVLAFYLAFVPGIFVLTGDKTLFFLRLQTDFLKTFTLTSTDYYKEYTTGVGYFQLQRGFSLLETPRSGSVMSAAFLRAAREIEEHITDRIAGEHSDGRRYGAADVCTRLGGEDAPCLILSAVRLLAADDGRLQALEHLPPEELGQRLAEEVPEAQRPQLQMLVGNPGAPPDFGDAQQVGRWLAGAKSLMMAMELQPLEATKAYEEAVLDYVEDGGASAPARASAMLQSGLSDEVTKIAFASVPILIVTIGIMTAYVVTFTGSRVRIPGSSQILVGALGTMIPAISSVSAFGLLGYLGKELNLLAVLVPFVGLAVGIDAVFLVTSSVTDVGPEETDPAALMSKALSRSGVAQTISTATSVFAFTVSGFTSLNFPGFSIFSFGLVIVLLFNWLGMLLLLPAAILLNERRILAGRRDGLFCLKRKANAGPGLCARLRISTWVRDCLCEHWPRSLATRYSLMTLGAALWLSLLIFGAFRVDDVGRGMPDTFFLVDGSPTEVYLEDAWAAFGGAYSVKVPILFERPALGSARFREGLAELLLRLESRGDALLPPSCWLADVAADLSASDGDAEAAAAVEAFFASPENLQLHGNDRVGGTAGAPAAARCHLFIWQPSDSKDRSAQAAEVRATVRGADVPATVYHDTWAIHVGRYDEILELTFSTAFYCCVTVGLALLLALPMHLAFMAMVNVACVCVTLFASMTLADINANAISFSTVIMAIGFCVDYTCHFVHFTEHGVPRGTCWHERCRRSLETCCYDVFQGCATSCIGVVLLYFAPARAFRMFSVMCVIITVSGGFFALWGLPAVLTLLSKLWEKCWARPKEAEPDAKGAETEGCCGQEIHQIDLKSPPSEEDGAQREPQQPTGVVPQLPTVVVADAKGSGPHPGSGQEEEIFEREDTSIHV